MADTKIPWNCRNPHMCYEICVKPLSYTKFFVWQVYYTGLASEFSFFQQKSRLDWPLYSLRKFGIRLAKKTTTAYPWWQQSYESYCFWKIPYFPKNIHQLCNLYGHFLKLPSLKSNLWSISCMWSKHPAQQEID